MGQDVGRYENIVHMNFIDEPSVVLKEYMYLKISPSPNTI